MIGESMMTNGDREAAFLREIADSVEDTNLGLMTIGMNEDKSFSVVALDEETGVAFTFTSPYPERAKDAFIEFCLKNKVR